MALEHTLDSPLALAVRTAGSQTAMGRILGKNQSVVHDWLKFGRPLPAEHVLAVEAATGISRHVLRPDIYPQEAASPEQRGLASPLASAAHIEGLAA